MTDDTREIPAADWAAPPARGASEVGQMDPDVTMPLRAATVAVSRQPEPRPEPGHRTPIADYTAGGWSQVFTIACQYPAALVATPIPCGAVFRDETAETFTALYRAAVRAGWRPDDIGRWACAECVRGNPAYRSPRHVSLWTGRALEAQQATADGWAQWVTASDELIQVSAEFPVTVALEWRLREAVLAAAIRPRHAGPVTA